MTVEEVRAAIPGLLRDEYPHAKAALVTIEVYRRMRSKKAVYELRDALDHIATIFRDDIDAESARSHLREARIHLRRCVVEPFEYLAERQFVKVDRYGFLIRHVPFAGNPAMKRDFHDRMTKAVQLIADGRVQKTNQEAHRCFEESYVITTDLLREVHPLQWVLKALGSLLVVVAATVTATIAVINYAHPRNGKSHTRTTRVGDPGEAAASQDSSSLESSSSK